MLEYNHCIKSIDNCKDFFIAVYTIIDDIYKTVISKHIQNRRNIATAIMSDSEIITISIVGELHTIDSEKAWYSYCRKNFSDLFPNFCDRSRFNRIRRDLHAVINEIRKSLNEILQPLNTPYRIVDSAPVAVCHFGRAKFHKTYRGYGASYGRFLPKKKPFLDIDFMPYLI